jgi:hypothetical protein
MDSTDIISRKVDQKNSLEMWIGGKKERRFQRKLKPSFHITIF